MSAADLLWLPVALPVAIGLLCLLLPGRIAGGLSVLAALPMLVLAAATLFVVAAQGPLRVAVGGWPAPLGIGLQADGFAALMLLMTALVCAAALVYAEAYFDGRARHFRPLAWLLWAGVNALLVSDDLFNLYVTLELVTLAAVGLAALSGTAGALRASLRYLMAALAGSMAFLLGVALLYGATGTLALPLLGERIAAAPELPVYVAALAAIVTGLALKSALFPLHGWLPPAHGGAVPPVSALLSALVVKVSFYVLFRLWTGPLSAITVDGGAVLGALGAAAVLWGALAALVQVDLKRLVAYSTVAQLGYLFLAFALLDGAASSDAGLGASLQALAHGLAKAAMFLAAGVLVLAAGDGRIDALRGLARHQAVAVFAFGLAGASLAGVPPTGGFAAKWLLLQAAWAQEAWHWILVILAGTALTVAYVWRVLATTLLPGADDDAAPAPRAVVSPLMGWLALWLAVAALLMGLATDTLVQLLLVAGVAGGIR